MNYSRRNFLQRASAVGAGALILPTWACSTQNSQSSTADTAANAEVIKGSLDNFGIQLYTLRDNMPKNAKGVLKKLSEFGYTQIEGYEGAQGMFWDMTPKDFKAYIDGLGLSMVASHCNINEDFETKAAQAAEIGMSYLICPYLGPQKSMDDWKKIVDKFNECGDICAKNGIRFAYHNHAYSFEELEGQIPQEYVMDNVNPETVDFEADLYWVVTAGVDPISFLQKYKDRIRLCHVKDRMKNAPAAEGNASCDLGTGSISYPEILKVAADNGMEYFIVEQERYDGSTPLKSAEEGAKYMKKLQFA
ncbi:MAG: sugar phosphate isomerase/epimerase [Bacteroidota bacterium]